MADPIETLRLKLVEQVRGVFNDVESGQKPVPPSDEALFERNTPVRMVHADIVAMMVGGIRGLLLQMLHPHALQGVLDHSNFRSDMHGRLRRTARFIAVTTFGHRDDARAAIERVNRIHAKVGGTLPDGTSYSATDPRTLAFVHVAEATSFLAAYLRHVRPDMPGYEQDEYYRQFALVARVLGADPVPESRNEAEALFRELRTELRTSPEAREVAQLVLTQRPEGAPPAVQAMLGAEAVAILPSFARSMLGLSRPGLAALPARAATWGMGKTLRWAFRQ
ncbi:oxygenase MpaB family protein [Altererythrobacter arenosus]|uniref:Oxygenase MpaB family protein n=1 Tax=Altererythrobacter arenosus TaxID=3032592 RepID=A0ABY8FW33_9SPHN|nr:oxygenase MpaB family protein [Altererythrobacter sp. CAU 1644]WFL77611.1 oxygenase MpaB family protein [Altererythrobacter sp. CAU 1644]